MRKAAEIVRARKDKNLVQGFGIVPYPGLAKKIS